MPHLQDTSPASKARFQHHFRDISKCCLVLFELIAHQMHRLQDRAAVRFSMQLCIVIDGKKRKMPEGLSFTAPF